MKRIASVVVFSLLLLAGLAGGIALRAWLLRPASPSLPGGKDLPTWIESLRTGEPGTEEQLRRLGPAGIDILMRAREEGDLHVHRRAVAALVAIGADAVPPLIEALPRAGPRAGLALLRIGGPAVPALIAALERPGAEHAAQVLGGLRERSAVPALILLVHNAGASEEARAAAARALGEIGLEARDVPPAAGTDPVLGALATGLSGPGKLRLASAQALEGFGPLSRSILPELARLSRERDVEQAEAACRALAALRMPEAAPPLLDRLLAEDRASPTAALGLARLGPAARPALPALVEMLGSDRPRGSLARGILERLGTSAVPDLVEALGTGSRTTRRSAAELLRLLPVTAEAVVPALTGCLNDPHAEVALTAARALARIAPDKSPALCPLLNQHLDGHQADFVALILRDLSSRARPWTTCMLERIRAGESRFAPVLARLGATDPAVVDALRLALKNTTGRARTIDALGNLGPAATGAIPDLKNHLNEPRLCESAALAIARISPPDSAEAIGILRGLLTQPAHAEFALTVLTGAEPKALEPLVPDLIGLLAVEGTHTPERVGLLLRRIGPASHLALVRALGSANPRLRQAAAWSLRDPRFQTGSVLVKLLNDPEESVRQTAAGTLAVVGLEEDASPGPVLAALGTAETDMRAALVRSLWRSTKSEIVGQALRACLLYDPAPEVREAAARTLGGDSAGLLDPDLSVRLACAVGRPGQAREVLRRVTHLGTPVQRREALAALASCGENVRDLLPLLEADTRGEELSDRLQAFLLLVRLEPERRPALVALLETIQAGWAPEARSEATRVAEELARPHPRKQAGERGP